MFRRLPCVCPIRHNSAGHRSRHSQNSRPRAAVNLYSAEQLYWTATDQAGHYSVGGVEPGAYDTMTADFELHVSSICSPDVLTAIPKYSPASVHGAATVLNIIREGSRKVAKQLTLDFRSATSNFTVTTNAKGEFSLARVNVGRYELNVSDHRYAPVREPGIYVVSGYTLKLSIMVLPKNFICQ